MRYWGNIFTLVLICIFIYLLGMWVYVGEQCQKGYIISAATALIAIVKFLANQLVPDVRAKKSDDHIDNFLTSVGFNQDIYKKTIARIEKLTTAVMLLVMSLIFTLTTIITCHCSA